MVNIVEFAQVLDLLDRIASPAIVNRALRSANLSRKVVRETQGFLPYRLEASVVEHVARALGDNQLGARLAQQFDYAAYDAYARYVLGATDLATAISRGQRAFPLISPGSEIVLRRRDGHLLVGRKSELDRIVGHKHLDDGAIVIIGQVMRHFLGPNWHPAWIEVGGEDDARSRYLEDMMGAPLRAGAAMPAVAVRFADLRAANPSPPAPQEIVGLAELPMMMGVRPPKSTADIVRYALATQFALGDLSQDAVARQLSMGRRNLQRSLESEGDSFREVKARFIESRARALLSETGLDIESVARLLGYNEPKSFQRAFRKWTGQTPHSYRAQALRL